MLLNREEPMSITECIPASEILRRSVLLTEALRKVQWVLLAILP
jgi:hypothetical protein